LGKQALGAALHAAETPLALIEILYIVLGDVLKTVAFIIVNAVGALALHTVVT
jgi:hypothetical protein